jgi:hypothetical protein
VIIFDVMRSVSDGMLLSALASNSAGQHDVPAGILCQSSYMQLVGRVLFDLSAEGREQFAQAVAANPIPWPIHCCLDVPRGATKEARLQNGQHTLRVVSNLLAARRSVLPFLPHHILVRAAQDIVATEEAAQALEAQCEALAEEVRESPPSRRPQKKTRLREQRILAAQLAMGEQALDPATVLLGAPGLSEPRSSADGTQ